jgi:hypothetical protein
MIPTVHTPTLTILTVPTPTLKIPTVPTLTLMIPPAPTPTLTIPPLTTALHGASKALYETLADVYETDWAGQELVYAQAQNSDMLWTDFVHRLQDQTLAPLTAYQIHFPEIRVSVVSFSRRFCRFFSRSFF